MLEKLNHPRIVRFLHFEEGAPLDTVKIFMDLAKYRDLNEYKKSLKSLSEGDVKLVAKQILEALHYLDDKKVLHRDLKPKNILIFNKEPLEVKLADFRIAKDLREEL